MSPRILAVFLVAVVVGIGVRGSSAPSVLAAPTPGAYSTQTMIPASYLGSNASPIIEFAPIPGRINEALVALQSGYIYRVALDSSFTPTLWGDIHAELTYDQGEQGLLSVAFSPDFLTSSRVYIFYTTGAPNPEVLSRFTATATDLNEASEEPLIQIADFAGNHNGGHIAFDTSANLYLSIGDGGGGGDPNENGQSLTTMLGKVLRIKVNVPTGYAIPSDNPFMDGPGGNADEIFAYGFRNPWRFTIDQQTNDVWVGDVGQANWEEVDRVIKGGNYGWDCYEGNHSFEPAGCSTDPSDFKFPLAEYDHSNGQAVTGGAVYRGTLMPELNGWYIYSDFYSGKIWAIDPANPGTPTELVDTPLNISSFTPLADGELAIVTYGSGIFRLAPVDQDADTKPAASDNCAAWPNTSQTLPAWPVVNDDPDCDGWSWNSEEFFGTDRVRQCASTPARNDEPLPDRWPVDYDDNQVVNGSDLLMFSPVFGAIGPNPAYSARYDLTNDGRINGNDFLKFSAFFYKHCT